jgi:membrane-associated phospholipid phosphatase
MSTNTSARSAYIALAVTIAATAVAMLADRTLYTYLHAPEVYEKDFGRLLRIMGFAGTWVALAVAVGLTHGGDDASRLVARRRGWLVFWSPMLAGGIAEVVKILVRRERPALNDGAYGFRPWDERTWSGAGLAFPSSHTAVAFGGAFMLARIFPRARWVGYVLAAGCGLTRVFARAHFLSDTVFAAGLGWLVSWLLWRKFAPRAAVIALLVMASLAVPRAAQAQQATSAENCVVYERCAYNLVPRGLGLAVVRGVQEDYVASLGFLRAGTLSGAFEGDSIADALGRQAVRTRRVAATLTVTALLAIAGAGAVWIADGSNEAAIGLAAYGGVALGLSVPLQFKADGQLSRAVWQYNRRFAKH